MVFRLETALLRLPEPTDIDALYAQKNDPDVAALLGGYSRGYSKADIREWIERHRQIDDEIVWVIADPNSDVCLGHVGLYRVDHRARSAEFAIMIGATQAWGKGIGKEVTRFVIEYGFSMLNLNRVELTLLADNTRALGLYEKLGFVREGVKRQAQYKTGRYHDVVLMSLLRDEFSGSH